MEQTLTNDAADEPTGTLSNRGNKLSGRENPGARRAPLWRSTDSISPPTEEEFNVWMFVESGWVSVISSCFRVSASPCRDANGALCARRDTWRRRVEMTKRSCFCALSISLNRTGRCLPRRASMFEVLLSVWSGGGSLTVFALSVVSCRVARSLSSRYSSYTTPCFVMQTFSNPTI